jgi:Zn-dependent oligopeptidase
MLGALALAAFLPNWAVDAAGIDTDCATAIVTMNRRVDALTKRGSATLRGTILPLENAMSDERDAVAAATFLRFVTSDDGIRAASRRCALDSFDARIAIEARPELYAAVTTAAVNVEGNAYDRALEARWSWRMERGGGALVAARRDEFLRLSAELAAISDSFEVNLVRDTSVDASDRWYLRDTRDADARKNYYVAYNRRAAAANVPLLERAIAIRDRIAHLLGYETWADYRLSGGAIDSVPQLQKFLQSSIVALAPEAQNQLDAMRAAVDDETRGRDATLQPWDFARARYLLARRDNVDLPSLRQYFPVRHTIDAALGAFGTLLGINFVPVTPGDAWSPDVLEYALSDGATNKPMGTLYLDVFRRSGKPVRPASFNILPVRGAQRLPVAAILAQWPSSQQRNAQLDFGDVVELFRQLGNAIPSLLAAVPYEWLDGFPREFQEAQAEAFAQFAWQPEILRRITSDARTSAQMPESQIDALASIRDQTAAAKTLRALALATIDLTYQTSGPQVYTTAVWSQTAASLFPPLYAPGTYPQVATGQLLTDDAGPYARAWARVYAPNLLSAFAPNDVLNPEVGMRYRRDVIEPQRTYPIDDELRAFLGHDLVPAVTP